MVNKKTKIYKIITYSLRISIIFLLIIKVVKGDFKYIHYLLTTFIFTYYDKILLKCFHFSFSSFINSFILIFIFLSQVLGRTFEFYTIFPFWDIILHTLAGILFYFLGKEIILHLNHNKINKGILIIFCLCFSLAMGTLWEILEFTFDWIFLKNTQGARGLIGIDAILDTMSDLIVLTIGAFFSSIIDFFKRKKDSKKSLL